MKLQIIKRINSMFKILSLGYNRQIIPYLYYQKYGKSEVTFKFMTCYQQRKITIRDEIIKIVVFLKSLISEISMSIIKREKYVNNK
jgi:hypothetical protein